MLGALGCGCASCSVHLVFVTWARVVCLICAPRGVGAGGVRVGRRGVGPGAGGVRVGHEGHGPGG